VHPLVAQRQRAFLKRAARRGVPLVVLDSDDEAAGAHYARKLVLVRPDRHVAWRAEVEPDEPLALIDHLRGARALRSRRHGGLRPQRPRRIRICRS